MNIDGFGTETVDLFFKMEFIIDVADIYCLTAERLEGLPGLGAKSISHLLDSIEESKNRPFHRVLFALGIRFIGETVAKKMTTAISTMDELLRSTKEDLIKIEEVGDKIADSFLSHISIPKNLEVIERLRRYGLQFESRISNETISSVLDGNSIVISGVFRKYSRNEIKELIEQHGGKNSSSISKNTSFIIAGENMGPSKREKAKYLGVKILSEDEFINLLEIKNS